MTSQGAETGEEGDSHAFRTALPAHRFRISFHFHDEKKPQKPTNMFVTTA